MLRIPPANTFVGCAIFIGAWLIYLGFVGPWLMSEPSTLAVLLAIAFVIVLARVTYLWATAPKNPKEPNE